MLSKLRAPKVQGSIKPVEDCQQAQESNCQNVHCLRRIAQLNKQLALTSAEMEALELQSDAVVEALKMKIETLNTQLLLKDAKIEELKEAQHS